MALIARNEAGVDLLARLMRAEAEADDNLGMLMAGNTGRYKAHCFFAPSEGECPAVYR